MIAGISKLLLSIFGSRNERLVKSYMKTALEAGEFEPKVQALSDEQLRAETSRFKAEIKTGKKPVEILPQAFSVVREAARRNMNMRHYDVQLIGGNVLFDGNIAEMATGEGKTLVATLAAYLMHLTGRRVHIVTVNDYLAKRDADWMKPVYEALGLTVGAIQSEMHAGGAERLEQYSCDITYGTNNEFGFDYLRDNMKTSVEQLVQGELQFALVDEVDSILIDEARTPLIISGPAHDDISRYKRADSVVRQLISLQSDYQGVKNRIDRLEKDIAGAKGEIAEAGSDKARAEKAKAAMAKSEQEKESLEAELETKTQYYEVEYDKKSVRLTHEGIGAAQDIANVGSFYVGANMDWPHLLEQSLRAHVCFEREKDYVVMDGKIVIVDEFTGRLMHGRQWSDGLHQAVEAKENVQIKEESQTLATITLQNFFKLYDKLAGMTGTAMTEAQEFVEIYGLDTIAIPTNRPCVRDDRSDVLYKTMREKFNAIVEEIRNVSSAGRPVLVGTISIEKSEAISNALTRKYGVEHEVLNAKQHAREATIVAKAGHQHASRDGKMCGNVTIATNMAGRGTDIKLSPEVIEAGGLHIIGTERHESRRIDNQLRGRAGRQGDNGSSQFFLSLEDDLLNLFASEWAVNMLSKTGWQEGEAIESKLFSRGIEKAQKKVEERNYEIRKALLEYDEVMDYQRREFYSRRRRILKGIELRGIIEEMVANVVGEACDTMLSPDYPLVCVNEWLRVNLGVDLGPRHLKLKDGAAGIEAAAKAAARKNIESDISITMGEYIEDASDKSTWNLPELAKWLMSSYQVNVSVSKLRDMDADEIRSLAIESASELVERKDCSGIVEFLEDGFAQKMFIEAVSSRFNVIIEREKLAEMDVDQIEQHILSIISEKYDRREIEYPVEFALNMTYGSDIDSIYAFAQLSSWIERKFDEKVSPEQLRLMSPKDVHSMLIGFAERDTIASLQAVAQEKLETDEQAALEWANVRFAYVRSSEDADVAAELNAHIREYMRRELSMLERYILLQIFDAVWKDHLYSMDRLKEGVSLRRFAEKDPKLEYKQEGYRMFNEMLSSIDNRVTDMIFKLRLEANAKARNVYSSQNAVHQESSQFAETERQRQAAHAPRSAPKQIINDEPKVGRNDPCPCGSGKKYKKCCGKES
ncbi:MAG: preprotein translocase subunit SecA [Phycisphaerae bacterium]|jgi:preprotein translocase subunit SecA